jgi:hypothetical protein
MPHQFDLLPVELQAIVVDLRAADTDEAIIDRLITRTLNALAVRRNRVQVEVLEMEERLGAQLTQIGDKLQSDLQTQHGATNTMLADLNTAWTEAKPVIEEAGRGIADLKKQWEELDGWRGRVEAALASFSDFRNDSSKDRADLRKTFAKQDQRHGQQIEALIAEFRLFGQRLSEIEQHLEIAGGREAEH